MINHLTMVPDWLVHIVMPVMRWAHIVCTAALLGGILFYEFVVPKALAELREEQQLAVFGRVRWVFRQIVVFSVIVLLVSGAINTWQLWPLYNGMALDGAAAPARPWWGLHVGLGTIGMAIVVRLTLGDRVPRHPIAWLRVTFVILLIGVFTASVARHIRLVLLDEYQRSLPHKIHTLPLYPAP